MEGRFPGLLEEFLSEGWRKEDNYVDGKKAFIDRNVVVKKLDNQNAD